MSNKDIVNLVSCIDTEGGNVPKSYATIFKRSGMAKSFFAMLNMWASWGQVELKFFPTVKLGKMAFHLPW